MLPEALCSPYSDFFKSHWPNIWNPFSPPWHSYQGWLSCTSSLTLTSTASCLVSLLWQPIHCLHCGHSDFQKNEPHCFSLLNILSLVPLWPLGHNPVPRLTSKAPPGAPVWPHLLTHFILYVTSPLFFVKEHIFISLPFHIHLEFFFGFTGVTAEMQNLVHRRIYPFLLMVVVLMGILSFQVRQFKRLYEHIKNDK